MSMTARRATSSRWFTLVWTTSLAVVVLLAVVLLAKWLRQIPAVESFMVDYPGQSELPEGAPVGLPAWLGWQHFFNVFFLVLIIRTGWLVRTVTRPSAHWIRDNRRFIRTKTPPSKISLNLWFHLSLDALWVVNGLVLYVLLFSTGQWMRVVPTNWDVFPNAVSTAIQYVSLNWPTDNGWVNYNSLQVLAYFVTLFIAAPLAIVTGLRLSPVWSKDDTWITRAYPIGLARAIHFPVMLYFVLFIAVHVTLVMATGALRNLNHMYATRDDDSWVGLWIFMISLLIMIVAWVAARPVVLRAIASLTGKVSR
jgi:thiosulfate reductase cytochrome b subunit